METPAGWSSLSPDEEGGLYSAQGLEGGWRKSDRSNAWTLDLFLSDASLLTYARRLVELVASVLEQALLGHRLGQATVDVALELAHHRRDGLFVDPQSVCALHGALLRLLQHRGAAYFAPHMAFRRRRRRALRHRGRGPDDTRRRRGPDDTPRAAAFFRAPFFSRALPIDQITAAVRRPPGLHIS